MTCVIAGQSFALYLQSMSATLLRILLFVAVLAMPFGMATAPASAQAGTTATAEHCGEHQAPAEMPVEAKMHCMACTALPAFDAPTASAPPLPHSPERLALASLVAGVEPDTATPPPKCLG